MMDKRHVSNTHEADLAILQREEKSLKCFLSVPRAEPEKEELVLRLRELRGEIALAEAQMHSRPGQHRAWFESAEELLKQESLPRQSPPRSGR
jgi:hypothetical protein